MISVKEAQTKVLEIVSHSKEETIDISSAAGYVLSKNIICPLDLPPFDQSAMDGYAILTADIENGKSIFVAGESSAGKSFSKKIQSGKAIRIFTGAEIPFGADAVIMQEKASVMNGELIIMDEKLSPGLNIRSKGSHIKKGTVALSKNTLLTPAAIGLLASMGLKKIPVFRKPAVAIIVTGNELQKPGTKLSEGKIYESNGITLESVLKQNHIEKIKTFFVGDNEKQTRNVFSKAMKGFDFILFSGGISVGDYDFVGTVLKKETVKEVFYKVKQKPGKPLYFGTKNKKYIFGLPGNPASVLTCFYEYVLPAIKKFSGNNDCIPASIDLSLTKSIKKKKGLTHFTRAFTDYKTVTPLDGQESNNMHSYAAANCLIVIPEETEEISPGERVEVHLL